jgi:tetratricopeptide (TPR) repeat protein/serine/threonine protein kinase
MNERDIFIEALQKETPTERRAYLDEACRGNEALRRGVEALLEVHERAGSFLESVAPKSVATVEELVSERPGSVIGPYKLLEQIGEGGFGVVFMAEQTQPIRRKVALKVLKPGMDTRQVVARFEAERQALALMDHPNIAHVFDGGETASGRPYFVMELVKGIPITDFCDQNRLSVRERLDLLVSVCQAVQHAHQKGVIHRDLKPSNVLVTLHDDKAVVKVIDFGIAKATGQQLTDKTLFTGFAQMVGTPLYMSPEQAGQSGLDADTRSDIYSLGVLLYELLTGTTPFDKERLRTVGYDELRRIIREEEPPRPSTRISTLGRRATTISTQRQSDPKRLSQLFRGELDWIVMKCLEKDRNRRYETAAALARDVERYLADEPVLACPPSAGYRLRKFARRHRGKLSVVAGLLAALVALAGTIGWNAWDRAVRRAEQINQDRVQGERADAELATVGTLRVQARTTPPSVSRSLLAEALAAAQRADGLLAHRPADDPLRQQVAALVEELQGEERDRRVLAQLEEVELLLTAVPKGARRALEQQVRSFAAAFHDYGVDVEALDDEQVVERLRARPIRAELAAALDSWGQLEGHRDRASGERLQALACAVDPDEWRNRVRAARAAGNLKLLKELAAADQAVDLPPESLDLLCMHLIQAKEKPAALALLRRARRAHPADYWIHYHLGEHVLWNVTPPQTGEAIECFLVAIAVRPNAICYTELGNAYRIKRAHEEARLAYDRAIALDPYYASAYRARALLWSAMGDDDKALADLKKAVELDPDDWHNHAYLGEALVELDQPEKAIPHLEKAVQLAEDDPGPYPSLGKAYFFAGKPDRAEAVLKKAVKLKPSVWGPYSTTLFGRNSSAGAYFQLGTVLDQQPARLEEALACYDKAIDLDPEYVVAHSNRSTVLLAKGMQQHALAISAERLGFYAEALAFTAEAFDLYAEALAAARKAIAYESDLPGPYANLGTALWVLNQLDPAIEAYHQSILRMEQNRLREPKHYRLKQDAGVYFSLGAALREKGRWKEAIAALEEAVKRLPNEARLLWEFGAALYGGGQLDKAKEVLEKFIDRNGNPAVHADPDFGRTPREIASGRDESLWQAHHLLGEIHLRQRRPKEALASFLKARELEPESPSVHCNLGAAWSALSNSEEAIKAFREALRLKPVYALAHYNLGNELAGLNRLDEAIACYRAAIKYDPTDVKPRTNLGNALRDQGNTDQALAAYYTALTVAPDAYAYQHIFDIQYSAGRLDEAIDAGRRDVELRPNRAESQCNLGVALRDRGEFEEALKHLRRGHELGQKTKGWPYDSDKWLAGCERLAELDRKLTAVMQRTAEPADETERVKLARLAHRYKQLHATAAGLWKQAFAARPEFEDDLRAADRYFAACSAAMAGCGRGADAGKLTEEERTRWRKQALEWLKADLASYARLVENGTPKDRALAQQRLTSWQRDTRLAGIRGAALARLPEPERQPWQQFWDEVAALARRIADTKK